MDIFAELKVKKVVEKLSKIAKTSLETNNLFIEMSAIEEKPSRNHSVIEELEKSGFINIVETSVGKKVEFYHLMM